MSHASLSYSPSQWQHIDSVGQAIEQRLQSLGVGLMMGGEPTFVSATDFESDQWRVDALGHDKRRIAGQLLQRLTQRFSLNGALWHYGLGKWYPGEDAPRWALGCYWRSDGLPIWNNIACYAVDGKDHGYTVNEAQSFVHQLVQQLGLPPERVIPADDPLEDQVVGYVLPLLPVQRSPGVQWSTCRWQLSNQRLVALRGDSPLGLRIPWTAIAPCDQLEAEAIAPIDAPSTHPATHDLSPDNSVRVALSVEVRAGVLRIFMPPLRSVRGYLDLIAALEATANQTGLCISIEGYPPPSNAGVKGFQITPDPGVLEVNIHPASDWQQLVTINTILYEEAEHCGLGTTKHTFDGRCISTGGGAHITIGGQTTIESPLLRRPDLLRSLITYIQHHPSLSYLFSDLFVGPTSQSPRLDEARHDSLYEMEIAFQFLQPFADVAPEVVDRLLRNLLIDVSGNTHRSALCVDKLFPVENLKNQLGILEFRGFSMPPIAQMRLVQLLLIRALVAWFWERPYARSLIRWGTMLHDRFLLPYDLHTDLQQVIEEVHNAGYPLEIEWFQPFFAFRFPIYGQAPITDSQGRSLSLELRHAIEPWHVLGEEMSNGRTTRTVDASMERLQVRLTGAIGHAPSLNGVLKNLWICCNGQAIPMRSTGQLGEYVGAVRFRARTIPSMLHPAIAPHVPLQFTVIERDAQQSIGGCQYDVNPPTAKKYETFPKNAEEARQRQQERFQILPPSKLDFPRPVLNLDPDYAFTLDLRRFQSS